MEEKGEGALIFLWRGEGGKRKKRKKGGGGINLGVCLGVLNVKKRECKKKVREKVTLAESHKKKKNLAFLCVFRTKKKVREKN